MNDVYDKYDDEELESTSFSPQPNLRLMRKAADSVRADNLSQRKDEKKPKPKKAELSCVCENCGHIFYYEATAEECRCPKCQAKYYFEPAEEISVIQTEGVMFNQDKLKSLRERVAEYDRQGGAVTMQKAKDTHSDDAKSQISLEQGSAEYKEYVEDIQESNPSTAETDEFHEQLEEHNEDLPEDLQEDFLENNDDAQDLTNRRSNNMSQKREIHADIIAALAVIAAGTVTRRDDEMLKKLEVENSAMRDVTVQADDYADARELK